MRSHEILVIIKALSDRSKTAWSKQNSADIMADVAAIIAAVPFAAAVLSRVNLWLFCDVVKLAGGRFCAAANSFTTAAVVIRTQGELKSDVTCAAVLRIVER